jgi:hypothetical protein
MGVEYSASLVTNLNGVSGGEYAIHCFVNGLDTFQDVGFANGIVSLPTKAGGHVRNLGQ